MYPTSPPVDRPDRGMSVRLPGWIVGGVPRDFSRVTVGCVCRARLSAGEKNVMVRAGCVHGYP